MELALIQHIFSFSARLWEIILESPLPWITFAISIISSAYFFGRKHANAQKDKEIAEKTLEYITKINGLERQHREKIESLEYQHRQELRERDKATDKWRERCYQLMIEKSETKGRSP